MFLPRAAAVVEDEELLGFALGGVQLVLVENEARKAAVRNLRVIIYTIKKNIILLPVNSLSVLSLVYEIW